MQILDRVSVAGGIFGRVLIYLFDDLPAAASIFPSSDIHIVYFALIRRTI